MSLKAKNPESCKATKRDFEKKKKGKECVILLLSQMSWLSSGCLSYEERSEVVLVMVSRTHEAFTLKKDWFFVCMKHTFCDKLRMRRKIE